MVDHPRDISGDGAPNPSGQIRRGIVPHPLFPRHDGTTETRDIRFVSFRRKLSDGRIEHCPDDIPAHEIQSWADVTGPWGGGQYQVIGKDQSRQEVASYPPGEDAWMFFNFDSRPFTPRSSARFGAAAAPGYAPAAPALGPSTAPGPMPAPAPPYAHAMHAPPYPYSWPTPPYAHSMPAPAPGYPQGVPLPAPVPPYAMPTSTAAPPPLPGYAHGPPAPGYAPAAPEATPPYAYGMPVPAPSYAPAMPAPPPIPAPGPSYAHAFPPPAPMASTAPAPAAYEPLAALIKELIREVRQVLVVREPAPAPPAAAAAPPSPSPAAPSSAESMMATVLNNQAELVRGVVTTALAARPSDTATKPAPDPAAQALQMLRAIKELVQPPPAQPSMTERLNELKALKDLTTPAAPAASAPAASELSEIFSGISTLMQADLAKTAAANAAEQSKPPPPERRPPPPPRHLVHWPGVGLVEVVHPDPPMLAAPSLPARAETGIDVDAIMRDPALRARVLAALGLEAPGSAQTAAPAPIGAPVPIAAPAPGPAVAPSALAVAPHPAVSAPIAAEPALVDPPNAPPAPAPPVPAPPAAAPSVPAPPVSTAPVSTAPVPIAPTPAPPVPVAPAAANDEPVPVAEPTQAPACGPRSVTDDDRLRAVYALQTIARMPPDQRRAELSKLPGMEGGNVDMFVQVLQDADNISPDAWGRFAAALPPDAVRVLVDGPRG